MTTPAWLMVVLLVSVLFIILGTTKLKLHPFIVLLLAAYLAGAMAGLPVGSIAGSTAGVTGGCDRLAGSIPISLSRLWALST